MTVVAPYLSPPIGSIPTASRRVRTLAMDSLTLNGVLAFLCCLAVFGSSVRFLRIEVLGLLIQPYLVFVGVLFPYLLLTRLERLPTRATISMALFMLIYLLSNFGTASFLSETIKLSSFAITLLCMTLLIRSRADFAAGVVGLMVATGLIGLKGLLAGGELDDVADAAMEGVGNKNTYSLYVLPAVLLGGYFILRFRGGLYTRFNKVIVLGCICLATSTLLSSGNRSGFIGLVLIAIALTWDRKIIGLTLVASLGVGIATWLIATNHTEALVRKYEETFENEAVYHGGDWKRVTIILTSIGIAFQHPILGISSDTASEEFAKACGDNNFTSLDAHNVYANVLAGSGLICFAALVAWFWTTARYSGPYRERLLADPEGRIAIWICRWLILVLAARSMFSRETLYTPGFCLGIGLTLGLARVEADRLIKLRRVPSGVPPRPAGTASLT